MKIDTLRDQSNVSSTNNSRELSVHSSVLSVSYVKRMHVIINTSRIQHGLGSRVMTT